MISIADHYAQKAKAKQKPAPTPLPDERFSSDKFKATVRSVLNSMGYESNFGNFKMWDPFINWGEVVSNRDAHRAYCHLVDDMGEVLYETSVLVKVRAGCRAEALKKIDKKQYSFVKWW